MFGTGELDEHTFNFQPPLSDSNLSRLSTLPVNPTCVYTTSTELISALQVELRLQIYHFLGFSTVHACRRLQTTRYARDSLPVRAYYDFTNHNGGHTQQGLQRPLRPFVPGKGLNTEIMRTCRKFSNECYHLLYGGTAIGIRFDIAANVPRIIPAVPPILKGVVPNDTGEEKPPVFKPPRIIWEPEQPLRVVSEPSGSMTTRALSHITHLTLGPIPIPRAHKKQCSSSEKWPWQNVYIQCLNYLAIRCPNLRILGILFPERAGIGELEAWDIIPLLRALQLIVRSCPLETMWMGVGKYADKRLDTGLIKADEDANVSPWGKSRAEKRKMGREGDCTPNAGVLNYLMEVLIKMRVRGGAYTRGDQSKESVQWSSRFKNWLVVRVKDAPTGSTRVTMENK